MIVIKYMILIILLLSSSYIGILVSKKYQNRVIELKEIKTYLSIFIAKVKLTYEPIPQIFEELGRKQTKNSSNITQLFKVASKEMKELPAGKAWLKALEKVNTNLKKEDIEVLRNLSNLLGKVDIEGQVNEIELVDNFLNTQIKKAEEESKKSEKMYKVLGITVGLAIVIVLF